MTTTNYTKGEWRIWKPLDRVPPEGEGFWAVYVVDTDGKHIAKVSRPPDTETIANATLITTAPDMYEALKECVDYFRKEIITQYMDTGKVPYFEGYKRGVLALAKAEGKGCQPPR